MIDTIVLDGAPPSGIVACPVACPTPAVTEPDITAFSASQLGYTVNVATSVASVAVTARKSDPNAVMSGSVTAGVGQEIGRAHV